VDEKFFDFMKKLKEAQGCVLEDVEVRYLAKEASRYFVMEDEESLDLIIELGKSMMGMVEVNHFRV